MWFIGGIIMMITAILPDGIKTITFFTLIAVLTLIPMIYSYVIYKAKYK